MHFPNVTFVWMLGEGSCAHHPGWACQEGPSQACPPRTAFWNAPTSMMTMATSPTVPSAVVVVKSSCVGTTTVAGEPRGPQPLCPTLVAFSMAESLPRRLLLILLLGKKWLSRLLVAETFCAWLGEGRWRLGLPSRHTGYQQDATLALVPTGCFNSIPLEREREAHFANGKRDVLTHLCPLEQLDLKGLAWGFQPISSIEGLGILLPADLVSVSQLAS